KVTRSSRGSITRSEPRRVLVAGERAARGHHQGEMAASRLARVAHRDDGKRVAARVACAPPLVLPEQEIAARWCTSPGPGPERRRVGGAEGGRAAGRVGRAEPGTDDRAHVDSGGERRREHGQQETRGRIERGAEPGRACETALGGSRDARPEKERERRVEGQEI